MILVMAIESPCTKICVIHAAEGLCLGCGRSLHEIASWANLSGAERGRVMAELERVIDRGGALVLARAADGLAVTRLILKMEESARTRQPVEVGELFQP